MFCCKSTRRYEPLDNECVVEYHKPIREQSLGRTLDAPMVKLAFYQMKDSGAGDARFTYLLCAPQKLMEYASRERTVTAAFLVGDRPWTLELTKDHIRDFGANEYKQLTKVDFQMRVLKLGYANGMTRGITRGYSLEIASEIIEALNDNLPSVMKQLESDAADWRRFQETDLRYESRFSIVRYGTRAKFATMPQWMLTNRPVKYAFEYPPIKFAFEYQGEIWLFQSLSRVDYNPKKRLIGLPRFNPSREFHHPAAEFDNVLAAINQAIPEWERAMAEEKAAAQEKDKAQRTTKQEEEERKMQERLLSRRAKFETHGVAVERWPKNVDN